MQTDLINQVSFVPNSRPVKGMIFAVGYSSPALAGGSVSTPAQADTPRPKAGTRPTCPKEHPNDIATGLPALEPATEPSDGSSPV